jgi:hypothetical protein
MSMTREGLQRVIERFEGWTDGFIHGAKIGEEPHVFPSVKVALYEFLEHLESQAAAHSNDGSAP